ncbi:hypothetical protein Taro_033052 [Colocasia esculenta]|uniref:Uncharacterized protein n=1 Tax=Colocasia esculenta TaxID=4460 RepID=A0A843W3M9_COLES|nr:hypothetical protein [Colocasia esculenta]
MALDPATRGVFRQSTTTGGLLEHRGDSSQSPELGGFGGFLALAEESFSDLLSLMIGKKVKLLDLENEQVAEGIVMSIDPKKIVMGRSIRRVLVDETKRPLFSGSGGMWKQQKLLDGACPGVELEAIWHCWPCAEAAGPRGGSDASVGGEKVIWVLHIPCTSAGS